MENTTRLQTIKMYLKMTLVALILSLNAQFATAQSNLLTNPGFETAGASGWTETLSASIYASDATGSGEYHGGTKGRSYWMNSGSDATGTLKQTMSAVVGGVYTASVWTRRENYATAFTYATLKIMNGATQLAVANLPYGGTYASTTLTGVSIPSGANITFQIDYKVPGGNAYLTVDDASFALTNCAAPTFSPGGGTYASAQSVTITNGGTAGATVRYTLDGTTPTGSSTAYSSPISISTTKTLKAIAFKSGVGNSSTTSATYTIGGAPTPTTYYVNPSTGNDIPANGTSGAPWRTVAYAASQVAGGIGHTISLAAGTYTETQVIALPLKVNVTGAGEASTIIQSTGVPLNGADPNNAQFPNWYEGTLFQLVSQNRAVFRDNSSTAIAPGDGSQTLTGFTIDGMSRQLKAGVWVENRNNVTMHHVTIKNCNYRGAVFACGDKDWYVEPAYYMTGVSIYNCTFNNTGKDLSGQTLGNLNIAQLNGANIYNITITDTQGYGIKFIYDGFFRNTTIHDCSISVSESDASWGEDIAIEFWNAGPGNQIYNITCNTWLSLVSHPGVFDATTSAGENLKVYGVKMIDNDASSGKESIEAAMAGLEIYNSYFQNKGFGVAMWDMGHKNITVRNCTFYNTVAQTSWANAGAIYIDNSSGQSFTNLNVYNNIFDNQNNAVKIVNTSSSGINTVNIKNNSFLNGTGSDLVTSGSSITNINFTNNLKNSGTWSVTGATTNSANVVGSPGYINTGNRYDNSYYAPSSASSFAVAKGTNVGLPYSGTAPDIGRYEWSGAGGRFAEPEVAPVEQPQEVGIQVYPNPSRGNIHVKASQEYQISGITVFDLQGKIVISKSSGDMSDADVDLQQNASGLYIMVIAHDKGILKKKVIISK